MKQLARSVLAALEGKSLTTAHDYFNRANAFHELGRYDEAIADYDRANELEPDYDWGMAWYNRGNSLWEIGRRRDSVDSYLRAIDSGTEEWGPYQNAAGSLTDLAEYEQAIGVYDRYLALKIEPSDFGSALEIAWIFRARPLYLAGRIADAHQSIESGLALSDNAGTRQLAGDHFAFVEGDWQRALAHYELSFSEEQDWEIRARLGITLANLGRPDEALRHFSEAIASDPHVGPMLRRDAWSKYLLDPTILDQLPLPTQN